MDTDEIHARFIGIANPISEELAQAIASIGPVELVPDRSSPLADRLCRAIAGQQLSVKAARSIWNRVMSSCNGTLVEYLAVAAPEELRACGLSAAKTRAVREVARASIDGLLDAHELTTLHPVERSKRLTAIWGVGQWTADMMGIFYFGDRDIWPDGDVTARKTLARLTSPRRKTIRTAARFAPYRSYLSLYMWKLVDAAPE
ncbi:MAG: DNA-3-methyladenine glycosylase 2 family protein [Cyanobacteria bacterium P01_E01_bin.34]